MSKVVFFAVPVYCFLACSGAAFGGSDMTGEAPVSAAAPAGAGDAIPDPAASQEDPNEVICHKGENPIGSHIAAKGRCLTRAQWKQEAADAKKQSEDMLRQQSR